MSEAPGVTGDKNRAQASSPYNSKLKVQHEPYKCMFLDVYQLSLRDTKTCAIHSMYSMTNNI